MNIKIRKYLWVLLLTAFFVLLPVSQDLTPQKAEAQWAVIDAANLAENIKNGLVIAAIAETNAAVAAELGAIAADTAVSAEADASIEVKEFSLDVIAWAVVNMLVEEMINSVTQWVASGFEGSPTFVTDLGGFLLDVGDKAVGQFLIESGPLSILCSPFKFDVIAALGIQYRTSGSYYEPRCTLTDVLDNFDAFVGGDFSQGGWDSWAGMTLNANNNPYGAFFSSEVELSASIQNARGQELKLLEFGKGFFSDKDCTTENGRESCILKTPGTVIEGTLNNSLDFPNKRLSVADEIDELVGTLLSQFVKTILSEAGGLGGFKAENNERDRTTLPSLEGIQDPQIESAYRQIKSRIISIISETDIQCEIQFNRRLPDSVTSQSNNLKYEDNTIHTEADVDELGVLFTRLKAELATFVANECV